MQHWLRGGVEDESERIADLVKFGVSEAEARAFLGAQGEPAPAVFGVWAGNSEALELFFRLKRCWRLHPFSGKPLGLDWGQVESKVRLLRVAEDRWVELVGQMEVCEGVVLAG